MELLSSSSKNKKICPEKKFLYSGNGTFLPQKNLVKFFKALYPPQKKLNKILLYSLLIKLT